MDIYIMGAGAALLALWCFFILMADKHIDIVFALGSLAVAAMIYDNTFMQTLAYGAMTSGIFCAIVSFYYIMYTAWALFTRRKLLLWQSGTSSEQRSED